MDLHLEQVELNYPLRAARLRSRCEVAKRQMNDQEQVVLQIPDEAGNLPDGALEVPFTAAEFLESSLPLLDRLRGPIRKVLRDGNCSLDRIAEVILVGGATRMKIIQDFVAEELQRSPRCEFNPDEVVAMGAAIQAALMADDAAVEDMVMTDVCPHTLGVDCQKELGGRRRDGYFVPVIHRNTTIPVSREITLYTAEDNQTSVRMGIFQGEARRVEDNIPIGELWVHDVPLGPAGIPVVIRFTYDLNAILEVEAFIEDGGDKFTTVIAQQSDLSPAQLRQAVEKMQALKFYPRDEAENRHLLVFAERAVGETNAFQRSDLESAIDRFEYAMNAGDPQQFDSAKETLLSVLETLGHPFEH